MLIPTTAADGILLDLRYGSVDNVLGRWTRGGRSGRTDVTATGVGELPMRRAEWKADLPSGGGRCAAPTAMSRPVRRGATRTARIGPLAGWGALGALAALLAGCARDAEPRTLAVPAAAAARIRMVCPPGTFIGTMTANCPQPLPSQPLPRAAPAQ